MLLKIVTLTSTNTKYLGYGIGFYEKGNFSFRSSGICQNVIIFGDDTSSSVHANNKTKNI